MVLVTIAKRVVLIAAARAAVAVLAAVGRELPLGEIERRRLADRATAGLLGGSD